MKILTCKDVATLLQAKPSTVYAWAEQGLIPSFKINGLLRFEETEVIRWIEDCKRTRRCYNGTVQARGPRKGG